jgi:integrase
MGKESVSKGLTWAPTSDSRIKRRYNGQLYARFSKIGIRVEQKLHETNIIAARKACDALEKLIIESRELPSKEILERIRLMFGKEPEQTGSQVLLGEFWFKFIEFRKTGSKVHQKLPWRSKTLRNYEGFYNLSFEPFWSNLLPTDIADKWSEFIDAEFKRSKKGSALNFENHFKYMRAFMSYLVMVGALEKKQLIWNPNPEVDEDGEDTAGKGIVIPDQTLKKMIDAGEGQFGLFVRIAAQTGMRSSEMTQLKKDRIDVNDCCIRLKAIDVKTGSKTKKGRTIPIQKSLMNLIKTQMERHPRSQFLFPNARDESRPMDRAGFYKNWAGLCAQVGIVGVTPHDLRHSFATKTFSNPAINPLLTCAALGMSMSTAQKHYIHFDEQHLKIVAESFQLEE